MSLSLRRVFDLARVFTITQKRTVGVTAGAVYAIMLALFLLGSLTGTGWGTGLSYHEVLFPMGLVLVGLVATSMSFSGMHRADRSYAYLTLPASDGEKFLEKLILSAVVFPVVAVASYFVFSLVLAGLSPLLFDRAFEVFNPFAVEAPQTVRAYIVASSVFLFGAAYFRSRHFVKTALAVAGLFILLTIVGALSGWAAFGDLIRAMEAGAFDHTTVDTQQFRVLGERATQIARVARFLGMWILPPVMWVLTWAKLRETEVSDAVR